jgi:ADP-heptose:LPS heptosyltransferase
MRGRLSIGESTFLIRNAVCHVGIDSFPMHIASVVGTKSVIIWGNTSYLHTGPDAGLLGRTQFIPIVAPKHPCIRPCHSLKCSQKTNCINNIEPEVISAMVNG